MPAPRQVLFIQGAGAGAHDEWDIRLVDSLRGKLGDGYDVRFPRMPCEDEPAHAAWSAAITEALEALDDGAVVVGHSVGGTILVNVIAETTPRRRLAAILLVAAPFVGAGGWPGDGFELPQDLGERLPRGVPVHLFHGTHDQTVPPEHAELFARAIPQAQLRQLADRDHQLNDDLSEVAAVIVGAS